MSKTELSKIGQSLYGARWKRALSKAIGRSEVTIWRWATGRARVPKDSAMAIRSLVK